MNLKKIVIFCVIVVLLLTSFIYVYAEFIDMNPTRSLERFSRIIESEGAEDIVLTIYYFSPFVFTMPVSVEGIMEAPEFSIIVESNQLSEQIDLLKQLSNAEILPTSGGYIDARIYYKFETSSGRKLFDVVMRSPFDSLFINGREYEMNEVFFEVVMPFLPETAANQWERMRRYGLLGGDPDFTLEIDD